MCDTEKADVERDVLAYLFRHQEAQDTLEGIVEWWLVKQRISRQTQVVREALDNLVRRNLLLEHQGRDARTRYGINSLKMKRISNLVKKSRA